MKTKIIQIFTALVELEAKGCHAVFFEYGNGLFRVRIFKGEAINEKVVCQKVINPTREPAGLDELLNFIENLKNHITATVFQCYKREFVKGEKAGKWEKTKSVFEFGDNATSEMLIDGSGYYITDPDNGLQYFIDMKQAGETEK
ncbi:hypothetical protein FACS1894169_09470 [Bacteroidia bacterium]|nr:hypothetical protein FACS1894169_09470 [Bacteroidia bacterium]